MINELVAIAVLTRTLTAEKALQISAGNAGRAEEIEKQLRNLAVRREAIRQAEEASSPMTENSTADEVIRYLDRVHEAGEVEAVRHMQNGTR